MSKLKDQVADFQLQGQLLGFILKDGYKIKYLKIALAQREYWLKLPKELRHQIDKNIVPGCWLAITGTSKKCLKTGKLNLQAVEVKLAQKEESENKPPTPTFNSNSLQPPLKSSKIRILVCSKSSCRKRGSNALCQALQTQIEDYCLQADTEIKLTGCLKQCKKGPNLVITPDKARYSGVTPEQIPLLLQKHLSLPKNSF
jgi:(2Fe-2S) ferredoxin